MTFASKKRLEDAFHLRKPDRTPTMGGWIADPRKILDLTGVNENEYWENPVPISIEAYRILGLDGLLDVNVPSERGGYTLCTERDMEERAQWKSAEEILKEIDQLPPPGQAEEAFDEETEYREKKERIHHIQKLCGTDMYWCPARWEVITDFEWFRKWGYENYLMAIALAPDKIRRLYEHSAEIAGCHARVVARLLREGLQPCGMLAGMDICGRQGPMVDPRFLRENYFPLVRKTIEIVNEAGGKIVWHCDGDIRPILDDILSLGVAGLQGFQEEYGVSLKEIVERKTVWGDPLLIFGPISVTRTLVQETPEGVRKKVREAIDICDGKASLVLKTSNEILPDVPLENLRAMYDAVR